MSSEEDPAIKDKQPTIKIREMTIDDLAAVFHLGEELFEAQRVPNTYRSWDEYEVTDMFYSDTEYCLIAECEDEVIGFALGTTITKSHSAWKYGHLVWLGVVPEFQRSGVAEKLFHRFQSVMLRDGVRMLVVDTDADNLPALHFFRKLGFGNPQQHIYLSLNLDNQRQRLKMKENGG